MEDKDLSHEESLRLINTMIQKAKNSYHDTGTGPILWGCVISLCGLGTFLQLQYGFRFPFDIWWLTLIAIIPQVFIAFRQKRSQKLKAYEESTMDAVWLLFGIGIFIISFTCGAINDSLSPLYKSYGEVHGSRPQNDFGSFSSAFFLLWYGFPTMLTGVMRKFKPMLLGGMLCWILAVISVFTSLKIDMLFSAIAAVFAWLIPGIILWKKNQSRKEADGI